MRPVDLETWNRRAAFDYFRNFDNPFFSITANLDVTVLRSFCRGNGISFSLALLYHSISAANSVREFRFRMIGDRVVEYDSVEATQTILNDDETFSFCHFENRGRLTDFVEAGRLSVERYRMLKSFDVESDRLDLIYYSVIPWVAFTSFTNAVSLDRFQTVPRLVFGKIFESGGRDLIPHSVEVHHAMMDGIHVGKYFSGLQESLGRIPDSEFKSIE